MAVSLQKFDFFILKVVCCTLAGIQELQINDGSDVDAALTWSRSAKEQ